jgi:hypothetical protein
LSKAEEKAAAEQASQDRKKETERIVGLVQTTSDTYRKNRLDEDLACLSLYRGAQWKGDGVTGGSSDMASYRAQQNMVFPAVDIIVSSLALDTPAVEPLDTRYWSNDTPSRQDDLTIAGRRLGAVLNTWSELDRLDYTTQEAVIHACIFGIGVLKTTWSPRMGRPVVRTKLPWEWFCDPGAQRIEDAQWCFEYFPLNISTLRERVNSGQYEQIKQAIKPDTYPKGLLSERDMDDEDRKARAAGLREYVSLVEFWDFKNKRLMHIHPGTKQVLLDVPLPWGRTYDVLCFHDAIGRVRGISDVELMASNQRDINLFLSARREMAVRLPERILIDRDIFDDQEEAEAFKNSKSWEPTFAKFANGSTPAEKIHVIKGPQTTFDFNAHLADTVQGAKDVIGQADYQNGTVKNIRTGTEASMVQGATQGRMNIRMRKLTRTVSDVFQRMMTTWKWAAQNPEESGLDMNALAEQTQGDTTGDQLMADLLQHAPKFKLLPFSPMMEDKFARRDQLVALMNAMSANPTIAAAFDMAEFAREIQEGFQLRPSLLLSKEAVQAAAANAAMAQSPESAPLAAQAGPAMPQIPTGLEPPPIDPNVQQVPAVG